MLMCSVKSVQNKYEHILLMLTPFFDVHFEVARNETSRYCYTLSTGTGKIKLLTQRLLLRMTRGGGTDSLIKYPSRRNEDVVAIKGFILQYKKREFSIHVCTR
jgi:hypothetical protein